MLYSRRQRRKKLRQMKQMSKLRRRKVERAGPELLATSQSLLAYLYPKGNWRGYADMKGLLEAVQPLRKVVESIEKKGQNNGRQKQGQSNGGNLRNQ